MRDRFFFPLAGVVAGAFVLTAMQPFAYRAPTGPVSGGGRNAEDITVKGEELHRFRPGNYDDIAIVKPSGGGDPVVRITRLAEETRDDQRDIPAAGPHLVLAEDVENAMESRPIEVEVVARASGDFAASQFQVDYYAKPDGESGWQTFNLTPNWQAYKLEFDVPRIGPNQGYDYLGIRPVAPDKRRVMEVQSVRIHAMGPKHDPNAKPAPKQPN